MKEPKLLFCAQRDSENDYGDVIIELECRFDDGQKFAAVTIDGDFQELANKIEHFLNGEYYA